MARTFIAKKSRITDIASFRPLSAQVRDNSTLPAVLSISDPRGLQIEFCEYRLRNIHSLFTAYRKRIRGE